MMATKNTNEPNVLLKNPTRRQAMTGMALAFGSLAVASEEFGKLQVQPMKEVPSSSANGARTSLHEEITLKATPQRVYEALTDGKKFAAFSGAPAEIDSKEGGAFSMFGGLIIGRNVELVPNQRTVQAWRPTHWEPGVYSIVRFDLKAQGTETVLALDHKGFPEGEFDHLTSGWHEHYFEPLKKYL